MFFLLVRVHLDVLIGNAPLLQGNPCPLNIRAELQNIPRLQQPRAYEMHNTHPARVEDKVLWVLMLLDSLSSLARGMREDLHVRDRHLKGRAQTYEELREHGLPGIVRIRILVFTGIYALFETVRTQMSKPLPKL